MFTASDGIEIDIRANIVPDHRALLILWPCMTGSTSMYRLPVKEFNDAGISVIQFNPRGHGDSGGVYSLEASIGDLHEYLESPDTSGVSIWFSGHSAGASSVLKFGTSYNCAKRYILVSPVLDSIRSYSYLYENGHQAEANNLISSLTNDAAFMLSLLENSQWMKREVWERNRYREKIDRISGSTHAGTLMEMLFIEGYNAFRDLELHKSVTSIFLPVSDNWFPITITSDLAAEYGIIIETIHEAGDHYFTGAWKYLWRRVLDEMILNT